DPGLPEPEAPPIAEALIRQTEEEQILREALAELAPRCRRLIEMLFFETPARPYADVAAELRLPLGSGGLTREQCIERLRRALEARGVACLPWPRSTQGRRTKEWIGSFPNWPT